MKLDERHSNYPFVYRYRGDLDRAISELEENYFYFANRLQLNDPLEANPQLIRYTKDKYELENYFEFIASTFSSEEDRNDFLMDFTPLKLKRFLEKNIEFLLKHYGVICLSETLKNLPMWANYANSSSGICLEFDLRRDSNFFNVIRKMNYVSNPSEIIYNPSSREDTLTNLFFEKRTEWGYEKEIRILKLHNGKFHFMPKSLTKVVLGYNFNENYTQRIKNIISQKYKNAKLYRMEKPIDYDEINLIMI